MRKITKFLRHIAHEVVTSLTPNFIKKHMISCEEVTQKMQSLDKLNKKDQAKIRMHLFICQCCLDYKEQLNMIQTKAKKLSPKKLNQPQQKRVSQIAHSVIQAESEHKK